MTDKEPRSETLLAARIMRAYPSLSCYSAATLAESLCAIERAQRRHAERCCSGEDGGYVKPGELNIMDLRAGRRFVEPCVVHDPEAEERAGKRILARIVNWRNDLRNLIINAYGACRLPEHANEVEIHNDPRGAVLLLKLPGEQEASTV